MPALGPIAMRFSSGGDGGGGLGNGEITRPRRCGCGACWSSWSGRVVGIDAGADGDKVWDCLDF